MSLSQLRTQTQRMEMDLEPEFSFLMLAREEGFVRVCVPSLPFGKVLSLPSYFSSNIIVQVVLFLQEE